MQAGQRALTMMLLVRLLLAPVRWANAVISSKTVDRSWPDASSSPPPAAIRCQGVSAEPVAGDGEPDVCAVMESV